MRLGSTKPAVRAGHAGMRAQPAPVCQPTRCRTFNLRVAAIEEQQTSQPAEGAMQQPEAAFAPAPVEPTYKHAHLAPIATEELRELELEELDAAQESLLAWMVNTSEEAQEQDVDEMVDYDDFGDEEYEEAIFEEVENLVEGTDIELNVGDKIVGTVYEIEDDGAYVEIGDKASGFVPLAECSFAKLKTPLEVLRVGMKREFVVVEREDEYGQVVLSLAAVEVSVFWHRIRQLQEEDVTVHVKVDSANKGGLLVKYGPYDGFVPVSQFGAQITVENMDSLVGSEIPVKFLEVDEERERLVFSNKRASSGTTSELQGFKIGDVVQGVVQSVKPYGAFIDLGGITGLLHLSQISHDRITSVDKILKEGDTLKVMILSQDKDRGRVTLSTKKLEVNAGDMLRDPQLVFEKAEDMARQFKERIAQAEMAARTDGVEQAGQEQLTF